MNSDIRKGLTCIKDATEILLLSNENPTRQELTRLGTLLLVAARETLKLASETEG